MSRLVSNISPASEVFAANRRDMLALLDEVRRLESNVLEVSDRRRPQMEKRGQMHPRDRVARLLDRGSPFLEFSTLVGHGMHGDDGGEKATGGANITGIGLV